MLTGASFHCMVGKMTEQLSLGVLIERLSQRRGLDFGGLSRRTLLPEPELRAILAGAMPDSSPLRRIASALDLHDADCLVMAGLPVPVDLVPLDPRAGLIADELVGYAIQMDAEQRQRLRQYVQSLPQQDRSQIMPALRMYEQYEPGLGATIVRMLCNRNLDWLNSAKVLFRMTGIGPLSASTVGAIGHGSKELSPELLVGFATVLGISAYDLAAVAGVELVQDTSSVDPAVADAAKLIWDIGRLSADQVRQVCDRAKGGVTG